MDPSRRRRKPEAPRRRTASPAPSPRRRGAPAGKRPRPLSLQVVPLQPVCELGTAGSTCPFHRQENRGSFAEPDIEPDLPASGPRAFQHLFGAGPKFQARGGTGEGSSKKEKGLAQTTWLLILILLLDVLAFIECLPLTRHFVKLFT